MNLRKIIQAFFFTYTVIVGFWFYYYIQQLKNGNYNFPKPASVEGFLPISALMGLKKFLLTGSFDPVHPAGLTIFIGAILMSIIVKKSFCSHICPVGFLSENISKTGFDFRINKWISYFIGSLKYLLLFFFIYAVVLNMSVRQITFFQNSPYNIIADAKMLYFFLNISGTSFIVITALILLTYLFRNFWCRFLCPYGALLGLFSLISPTKIKREEEKCINCRKCKNECPSDIEVFNKQTVYSVNCIGCLDCTTNDVSHKQQCLKAFKSDGTEKYHKNKLSLLAVAIFLSCFIIAYLTGHWNSPISNEQYARFLEIIHQLGHP